MGRTSSEVKNRYNAKAYDRINFVIPKGEKEVIRQHAESRGESVNAFILRAVNLVMEKESGQGDTPPRVWAEIEEESSAE